MNELCVPEFSLSIIILQRSLPSDHVFFLKSINSLIKSYTAFTITINIEQTHTEIEQIRNSSNKTTVID